MRSTPIARCLPHPLPSLIACTLLSVATLLPAQGPKWQSIGSSTEGFRAQFPGEPQVSKNSVPVNGENFELRSYETDAGSTSLYVGVCDYGVKGAAADPRQMLSSAEKGAVEHMGAHILTEKKIALGSSPGVEFLAESDSLHFTVRMYMAGSVLYQTMVATPLKETFADTARFLDSLELLPPKPLAPAAAAAADWKQYRYADNGFSAWFPLPPELQKQTIKTESGPVELRTYIAEDPSAALIAAVCDYGAAAAAKDPDVLLEDAKKGAILNVKGHLISEKKITLGAYRGIEFEADSETAHVSARLYLVGNTLYQMIVAAPVNARFADTARFLDSFELIPMRSAD